MQGGNQASSPVYHRWQTGSFLMKAFALDVPDGEGVSSKKRFRTQAQTPYSSGTGGVSTIRRTRSWIFPPGPGFRGRLRW